MRVPVVISSGHYESEKRLGKKAKTTRTKFLTEENWLKMPTLGGEITRRVTSDFFS